MTDLLIYLKLSAILAIGMLLGIWLARMLFHITGYGAALIGIGFALAALLVLGRRV